MPSLLFSCHGNNMRDGDNFKTRLPENNAELFLL